MERGAQRDDGHAAQRRPPAVVRAARQDERRPPAVVRAARQDERPLALPARHRHSTVEWTNARRAPGDATQQAGELVAELFVEDEVDDEVVRRAEHNEDQLRLRHDARVTQTRLVSHFLKNVGYRFYCT